VCSIFKSVPGSRQLSGQIRLSRVSCPSSFKSQINPSWTLNPQPSQVDDLLKFASGLDFDQYIEDYEVRNAIAAVKNRISELAQAKSRHPGGGKKGQQSYFLSLQTHKIQNLNPRREIWHERVVFTGVAPRCTSSGL
jgi:hypothetical protein